MMRFHLTYTNRSRNARPFHPGAGYKPAPGSKTLEHGRIVLKSLFMENPVSIPFEQ